ncbi:enoyl-CoA hydratase/isomerase family protein [Aquibium carbonis]|uniref:3-hydroxyisobutyryl-CoA hydrolase n=1 Tax=Aquibium carbonis TaxID=2495581 RepID=A0A3R9YUG2_9HYPH|nr:enoyl-CoA hydratase/isomerase family protein [Aquibium carbonis]RST87367.1 enoyl-CoA hydratase/isomerase family protein [Aquibium carbonis]
MDFGGGQDIRFERRGRAGVVTMTRPKALNAVTHGMVLALTRALEAWSRDDSVALVVIGGEGRAFCAGGDILEVYAAGKAGRPLFEFFADEYRLNAAIARFEKPYVALVDGIVMGGGVGVSVHGSHRVFTENAVFAMPEVGIGFFPDVGGSFFLPRLKGSFGAYLALTGNRIRWGDALWSGIATHTVRSSDSAALLDALCETGDADAAGARFAVDAPRETSDPAITTIGRHFSLEQMDHILSSLEEAADSGDEVARQALATLRTRSPTSLLVTLRALLFGGMLDMDECMRMEFRILNRMLTGHDFYEGIRAALIDKGSTPAWRPARIEDVEPAAIEAYFEPLAGGELMM